MFFPIIKVPGFIGFTDLIFQGPNNWENRNKNEKILHLIWSTGQNWSTKKIGVIQHGERFRITTDSLTDSEMANNLAVIYPSSVDLPKSMNDLPIERTWVGDVPAWRATTGLMNEFTQTSYQADVEPLPNKASMLTFHPFIQFGEVLNFLLVLNLRKDPRIENANLEIYNSYSKELIDTVSINSNSLSVIPLNNYGFIPTDLPLFLSRNLAGIPFGFAVHKGGQMLSLEHTHPPASFTLFGNRNKAQGKIKTAWISNVSNHS